MKRLWAWYCGVWIEYHAWKAADARLEVELLKGSPFQWELYRAHDEHERRAAKVGQWFRRM